MLPSLLNNNRTRGIPSIFEELDSIFAPVASTSSTKMLQMPVDIVENEGGYEVKADLPGFKKEDLDIEIRGRTLRISATKSSKESEGVYLRHERTWGKIEKVVTFPTDVDAESTAASLEDGVLTLFMDKKETGPPSYKVELS